MDDAGNCHNNQKPSILTKQQGLQVNDPACTSTNITTDGDGGLSSRNNEDAVQHLEPHDELMQILSFLKGDRSRDVSNEENASTDAIINQQISEVSSETTAHTDENDEALLLRLERLRQCDDDIILAPGEARVLTFDELVARWEHGHSDSELESHIKRIVDKQFLPAGKSKNDLFLSAIVERFYQLIDQDQHSNAVPTTSATTSTTTDVDLTTVATNGDDVIQDDYISPLSEQPLSISSILSNQSTDNEACYDEANDATDFDLAVRLQQLTGVAPAILLTDQQINLLATTLLGVPGLDSNTTALANTADISGSSQQLQHTLSEDQEASLSMQLRQLRNDYDDKVLRSGYMTDEQILQRFERLKERLPSVEEDSCGDPSNDEVLRRLQMWTAGDMLDEHNVSQLTKMIKEKRDSKRRLSSCEGGDLQ